ncbi:MAG: hypothetical protein HQL66_04500 [Magnetococcales bacterium]|nr:hypothetical protein [Magnetococcales bacterium]
MDILKIAKEIIKYLSLVEGVTVPRAVAGIMRDTQPNYERLSALMDFLFEAEHRGRYLPKPVERLLPDFSQRFVAYSLRQDQRLAHR